MKELAGRLSAVDPVAGAAVGVIAYFDRLAEARAGVEALVRGAAVLAGVPVRLVDEERRVRVRVEPDGVRRDADTPPDPAWPSAPLTPGGRPALWLERTADSPGTPAAATPSVVDAVILERAAGVVSRVLDRTRGRAPSDDPALVETLLDAGASEQARLHAARGLGLAPDARARVVAPAGGPPYVVPVPAGQETRTELAPRAGVGPALPLLSLPGSWAAARVALRFTAEGTAGDPGQRVVYADDLGGIALLAETVVPGGEPPPDVRALERAAVEAPWMLATLHAVASTQSLRAAAAELTVHHSTLQDRLVHAEQSLGWPVRTPQGRFRLQLALTMRRLARPAPSCQADSQN
ncbi:helix-turn-helix domain-containing protein [Streptomyces niveiscabiei]|uniref:helix-turn-helix domain-containing protein n=1 Tax=Streptomyces niveiscabiei TaxID=164115 RepID=UPI0006EB9A3A|nr:helix-turn-helix domain-containing protein [Streptomyces niveiscabiei]